MENFEEKRQEYFKRLEENEELIITLAEDGKNKQMIKILLNPTNEKELNYANKYFMFLQDCRELVENPKNENIEEIDFNNCAFMDFLSSMTELMYNNASAEEFEKKFKPLGDDINLVAEISYQAVILASNPPENMDEIIENKCNIDINSELEFIRFSLLLSMTTEKINAYMPNNMIDENSMDKFLKFADKFHELCVNGIKKNSDSKHDELLDTLIYSYKKRK